MEEQEELLNQQNSSEELKTLRARVAQLENENARLLKVNNALFMSQPAVDTSVKQPEKPAAKTEPNDEKPAGLGSLLKDRFNPIKEDKK